MTAARRHRYVSVARTVFWRHMHTVFRRPALLLPALVFPLFFYMAFAGGLSRLSDIPAFDYYDYNAFQFTFVLLQSAAFGGIFIGFSIGQDFDSGILRRVFVAAGDRSAIFVGYGAAALVLAMMVWAMVFVIALVTGMDVLMGTAVVTGIVAIIVACGVFAVVFYVLGI